MLRDYVLFLNFQSRFIQALYEYLGDKASRKATLVELADFFATIFRINEVRMQATLLFKSRLQVANPNPITLNFLWIPTDVCIIDADIQQKLAAHLYSSGSCDLALFGETILSDRDDRKLKVSLLLEADCKLSATLEVVPVGDPDLDPEDLEVLDWPNVIPG